MFQESFRIAASGDVFASQFAALATGKKKRHPKMSFSGEAQVSLTIDIGAVT